jgi:alcohol dehydrogenase class IV
MIDLRDYQTPFDFCSRTKVIFGDGTLSNIGELCKKYGNSVLLVSGNSAIRNGKVEYIKSMLKKYSISVYTYSEVQSDPTVDHVNRIIEMLKNHKPNLVIAFGGGSVIDASKVAAAVSFQGGRVEDYLEGKLSLSIGAIPLIAIPTTAGTGAELSKGAIISWPEKKMKRGIRGNSIYPLVALVDPENTLTLPIEQIIYTGFDCFTHAVETFISNMATPITAMYSKNAIVAITKYLPIAVKNPDDRIARRNISFHSMLMGYNLANSSTCLPHRLQYPLGVLTGTPHGLGLASLYPTWVELSCKHPSSKFTSIAKWVARGMGYNKKYSYLDALFMVESFMSIIDIPQALPNSNITKKDCEKMAQEVSGNLSNDPLWSNDLDLATVFKMSQTK